MGQYYKAVVPTTKEYVSSHDFVCGAKLMEHSWMRNSFVEFVESLIAEGGSWYGKPLVWAGDYADAELDENGNVIKLKNRDGSEYDANLFDLKENCIKPSEKFKPKRYRYIINEAKKQFVDKNKCPDNGDGWRVHPLPLLINESNNRGCGDYAGDNIDNVGIWARYVITVSTKKPKGYAEIKPDFLENR